MSRPSGRCRGFQGGSVLDQESLMANYYSVAETAKILKVTEDDVKRMVQDRQLHGYRAGADWKFKTEEIDRLAQQRREEHAAGDAEGDVLLSEIELGGSEAGASGTVIGMESPVVAGSGLKTADSKIELGTEPAAGSGRKGGALEELDLTLEEDVTLEESTVGKPLEDDDLVLGGSGSGSDVTIGGDSGISLVDPADSGLSLEEPLELAGSGAESLELGEDDMISLAEDGGTEAPTELKGDDEFLLTPLEDAGDADDSESGSQVIALDTEGDEAATMIASGPAPGVAAMLEEDFGAQPALDLGGGLGGMQPAAQGMPLMQSTMTMPEAPYSVWDIVGLVFCGLLLLLAGMMLYDLVRHMWSWDNPVNVNSSIMDWLLGLFEG